MTKPVVIIDITAILFRMYFAKMQHQTPEGLEVGGVWGVLTTLKRLRKEMKPAYIAAVFDAGMKTFRNDICEDYKSNRGSPPEDLIPQFDLSYRLCTELGIPSFRMPGFEADDVMASLATLACTQQVPVQLVTVDKDLNQLVKDDFPSVVRIDFFKKQVVTRNVVKDSMGVFPEQCVDYLALVGDAVDNISGVRGIGPKTARELLNRFGSLDNIYENLHHLYEKKWVRIRALLEEGRDKAYLSQKLVTLKSDIDFSNQITDFQEDLIWKDSDSYHFLKTLGLQRYASDRDLFCLP